jgi:hypothetical protein
MDTEKNAHEDTTCSWRDRVEEAERARDTYAKIIRRLLSL